MRNMKRWVLASLMAMAGLALGRTVTYTQASLEGLAIVGPGEHTLVLPPDFQPYTYTVSYSSKAFLHTSSCQADIRNPLRYLLITEYLLRSLFG